MQTQIWKITNIINWYPFKSSDFNSDWKWLLIIRIQDMEKWINNNSKFWDWKYDKKVLIQQWDILVSLSWSFKVEKWNFKPALLNQRIIKIESFDESNLLTWYLYYYLTQKLDEIKSKATNTSIPNISVNDIKNLQIPLPPLSHQKQIIQKLDTLTNLINLRKLSIEKTEKLTKSIFIEMFWDPMINEKGWEVKEIQNLVEKTKNSLKTWPFGSALKKEFYVEKWWKIYWQEQVIKNDINYWDYYISDSKYNELINYSIKEWDVLISLVWSYWNLLIIPENFEAWIINPRLLKITFDKELINPVFFKFLFLSDSHLIKLDSIVHWWTMWILNLWLIKSLNIYIPPISLQNKFASIVETNEENIKKQKESLKKLEELYASVMQESFRV